METINDKTIPRAKIIVGRAEHGFKGMKKPMKSITVINATVDEVYNKIVEMINNEK